jgi:hypothetical protein
MLGIAGLKVQAVAVLKDYAGFSQAFSALKGKSTAEMRRNRTPGLARFTRESPYK